VSALACRPAPLFHFHQLADLENKNVQPLRMFKLPGVNRLEGAIKGFPANPLDSSSEQPKARSFRISNRLKY
jgi:hypothetical protein